MYIRPAVKKDIQQIGTIANQISQIGGETNISHVDFIDSQGLIEGLTDFDHMLVLETETPPTEICAAVLLSVNSQIFLRRTASLKIIVSPQWQGQGIGKVLMNAALELAEKELMLERVEVEVPIENVNGLKLCKSAGFKVEGIAKDWARTADGAYIDSYLMARCRNTKQQRDN